MLLRMCNRGILFIICIYCQLGYRRNKFLLGRKQFLPFFILYFFDKEINFTKKINLNKFSKNRKKQSSLFKIFFIISDHPLSYIYIKIISQKSNQFFVSYSKSRKKFYSTNQTSYILTFFICIFSSLHKKILFY